MKAMMCLVSRQAMPNLLPVLMFKPDIVYLLSTKEEKQCAIHLKNVFHNNQITTQIISNIDAYNGDTVQEIMSKILNQQEAEFLVNVTGGTKLMSLAAYQIANECALQALYCNTERKEILWLLPQKRSEALDANLTIEDYLLAYGYRIKEEKYEKDIADFFGIFTVVNRYSLIKPLAEVFEKGRKRFADNPPRGVVKSTNGEFQLEKNFDRYILSSPQYKVSCTIQQSKFNLGSWLEYWTYYQLRFEQNLEAKFCVKVVSDNGNTNEIDCIVLKDYVLYLLSCKSGVPEVQKDLFQIETLRTLISGTFGKGVLVTAGGGDDKMLENRALDLKIKLLNCLKEPIEI